MTLSKPVIYVSVVILSTLGVYGYYQSTKNIEVDTNLTTKPMSASTVSSKTISEPSDPQPEIIQKKDLLKNNTSLAKKALPNSDKQEEIIEDSRLLAAIDNDIAETTLPMLWEALNENEDLSHVKISAQIQGAEKIKINQRLLKNIVPGDQIQLPTLNGNQYTVNIEKVNDNQSNVNIRGHIEAFGSSYLATITQGEKLTFATLSTPEGTYDLRLVDGKGWVYDADQLNAHIDTTKPDTLLPPNNLIDPKT